MSETSLPFANSAALIPAAGIGERLGRGPKALLNLGGRTLLEILLETLTPLVEQVFVAAPSDYESAFRAAAGRGAIVLGGGADRQESIDRMLAACDRELLLIQDAARPFARRSLCSDVLQAARAHGAAGAFLDPAVPVGHLANGSIEAYWSRSAARVFQAPQAFSRTVLSHAQAVTSGRKFQSTAQMVISAGHRLVAVEGVPENIKITTPLDWEIAQRVIAPALGLI